LIFKFIFIAILDLLSTSSCTVRNR